MNKAFKKLFSGLSNESKNKMAAIWISRTRIKGSKTLYLMFAMDDEFTMIYQKNLKKGFSEAQIIAYKHILDLIYGK